MFQPTCYNSGDRFITICLVTSAGAIPGFCGNQSPLGDPAYVTAPFVSKHLILINGWWRQWQAGWSRRIRSIVLSAMMQSDCLRLWLIIIPILDTGHFVGKCGRGASSRCSSHHSDYAHMYLFQLEIAEIKALQTVSLHTVVFVRVLICFPSCLHTWLIRYALKGSS